MNSDDRTTQLDEPIIAKHALLEKRLLEAGTKRSALHTVQRRTDREFAPLSFSERRLGLLNQREPKRPVYNQARILQLTSPQDSKVLERWFIVIIDRHNTLRTTIATAVGSTIAVRVLRRFIQHKLSAYMAAAAFVFLDSLARIPNGKLDQKALPALDQSGPDPDLEDALAAPRNPMEEILANIWTEVLTLDKVGIHNNFVYLGRHSLLVVSRIRYALKLDWLLRTLFEALTIQGFGQKPQGLGDKQEVAQTAPLAPVPREQNRVRPPSWEE